MATRIRSALAISISIAAMACSKPRPRMVGCYSTSVDFLQRSHVDWIAGEIDPETCRPTEYVYPQHLRDAWGSELRIYCFRGYVRVVSLGPDRMRWTADDIRSHQPYGQKP